MSSDTVRHRQPPAAQEKPKDEQTKYDKAEKKVRSGSNFGCVTLMIIGAFVQLVLPISMFILYTYVAPEDSYPVPFTLPDPPSITVNNHLASAERLFDDQIHPAEQILHKNGDLYTGLLDGRIVRISRGEIQTVARFGTPPCGSMEDEPHCGTPLGLKFDADGYLIVCDAYLGLYKVNVATGDYQLLLPTSVNIAGRKIGLLNNLDITTDGLIYMTDSSVYGRKDYSVDLLDGRPTGRLLRYDPVRNTTEVLMDGLGFANGVQLSRYGDYVLVAETFRARVHKYHIKGVKAGTSEVFADNLPILPDNIRPSSSGGYWIASGLTRYKEKYFNAIDFIGPRPWIRKVLSWVPQRFWLDVDPEGSMLIELNTNGEIVRVLMDKDGKTVRDSSAVEDLDGVLYIGSYKSRYIARIDARKF